MSDGCLMMFAFDAKPAPTSPVLIAQKSTPERAIVAAWLSIIEAMSSDRPAADCITAAMSWAFRSIRSQPSGSVIA